VNLIRGVVCIPVVCQPDGYAFRWQDADQRWHRCDVLPPHVAASLPGIEWSRCEAHRHRRMGDRRGAA
jgi:hypothetical protein